MAVSTGYSGGAIALMVIFYLVGIISIGFAITGFFNNPYGTIYDRTNFTAITIGLISLVIGSIPFFSKAPPVPTLSVAIGNFNNPSCNVTITNGSSYLPFGATDLQLWNVKRNLRISGYSKPTSALSGVSIVWIGVTDRSQSIAACGKNEYVVRAYNGTMVYSQSDPFAIC